MTRGRRRYLCIAMLVVAGTAGAQGPSVVPSRLVRCAGNSDVPCLLTRLDLSTREARLAAHADSAPSRSWTGKLAGLSMIGPTVRPIRATASPFRLMILLDLSGSMRGEGVAFVRSAVRTFLAELPPTGVTVAVAPFESRQVAERIAAARYVSPVEAMAVLDALPAPDAAGNTALFDAVRFGLASVVGAVGAAAGTTRGGLLVVTDGKNDVSGRRDDPGLLAGVSGRTVARDAVDKSGQSLWIIGAGKVDAAELRALAGPQSPPYIIELSPILLHQSLTSIASEISTARELVFGLTSGSRFRLARARTVGGIRFQESTASGASFSRSLAWRPPLLALPAFEGVADSASLPAEVRAITGFGEGESSRRWLLVIFFALNGVLVGGALPRFAWAAPHSPTAVAPLVSAGGVAARTAATPPNEVGAVAEPTNGLRSDVHEVAPRTPDEITGSFRRVAP